VTGFDSRERWTLGIIMAVLVGWHLAYRPSML